MIRNFCLLVALSMSAVMGSPAIAQQQFSDGGYYLPPTTIPSDLYVQGTVVSASTFQPPGNYGYEATTYPTATYTYADSSYSSPIYSTVPEGKFATYPSVASSWSNIPSNTTTSATPMASGGLAQQKAQQMAQMNMRGHVGGGLGRASYEGVGWSTVSSQHAIQQCCYWGQRPVSQIGVARGNDGCWYACVLYR